MCLYGGVGTVYLGSGVLWVYHFMEKEVIGGRRGERGMKIENGTHPFSSNSSLNSKHLTSIFLFRS